MGNSAKIQSLRLQMISPFQILVFQEIHQTNLGPWSHQQTWHRYLDSTPLAFPWLWLIMRHMVLTLPTSTLDPQRSSLSWKGHFMWAFSPLILRTASSPRSFTRETFSSSHKFSFTSSSMWEQQTQWPLLHWVARTQAWSLLQMQCLDQSQQYQLMFSQRPSNWTRMWLPIFNLDSGLTTTPTRMVHILHIYLFIWLDTTSMYWLLRCHFVYPLRIQVFVMHMQCLNSLKYDCFTVVTAEQANLCPLIVCYNKRPFLFLSLSQLNVYHWLITQPCKLLEQLVI